MKIVNMDNPVTSHWLCKQGCRFDCKPFLSGAVEARVLLEKLKVRKDPLQNVTLGGMDGIYHAGREGRTWVDDPEYGVPFLGSSSILNADLSHLPLLSRKQIEQNPKFTIRKDWTLITRSGTIGRMVYSREDMDGMACSEHVMRVVPDPEKIPPGYLYAFLSSRFGVPLVVSGTYGPIIQHIEPEYIANLPVPRLGKALETHIDKQIQRAALLRTESIETVQRTIRSIPALLGLRPLKYENPQGFSVNPIGIRSVRGRLDAHYHSLAAYDVENSITSAKCSSKRIMQAALRAFKPPIFKRIWVDSAEYGPQFISGNDAYRWEAEDKRFVSKGTRHHDSFILQKGWVIFQAAGQLNGIFGKPLLVHGWLEGLFCADDMYRIVPKTVEDGAYLFAFLSTPYGEVAVKRQASGDSIPRLWGEQVENIIVPWPSDDVRRQIAAPVLDAHELAHQSLLCEHEAGLALSEAIRNDGRG